MVQRCIWHLKPAEVIDCRPPLMHFVTAQFWTSGSERPTYLATDLTGLYLPAGCLYKEHGIYIDVHVKKIASLIAYASSHIVRIELRVAPCKFYWMALTISCFYYANTTRTQYLSRRFTEYIYYNSALKLLLFDGQSKASHG